MWPFTRRPTGDEAITLATLHGCEIEEVILNSQIKYKELWESGVVRVVWQCRIPMKHWTAVNPPREHVVFMDFYRGDGHTAGAAAQNWCKQLRIRMPGPCADLGRRLKNWWQRALTNYRRAP